MQLCPCFHFLKQLCLSFFPRICINFFPNKAIYYLAITVSPLQTELLLTFLLLFSFKQLPVLHSYKQTSAFIDAACQTIVGACYSRSDIRVWLWHCPVLVSLFLLCWNCSVFSVCDSKYQNEGTSQTWSTTNAHTGTGMVLLVFLLGSVYITGLLTFCYSTLAKPFLQAYLPKLG